MKVLVTGSAGFIAYHTILRLIKSGYEVHGIDNLNSYYSVKLKNDRIKSLKKISNQKKNNFFFYKLDIRNIKEVDKLFKKHSFKYVIHLAAQAGVRYSVNNPNKYVSSNLIGFVNMLELCKHNGVKHFIFASSSSVYGLNNKNIFKENQNTDHPLSLYAATKKSNEVIAHSYSYLHNIRITGLRFFTVYGPWGRPDMAYFSFVKSIFGDRKIKVHNFGNHKRDFSYIDTITDGILKILKSKKLDTLKNLKNLTPDKSSAPFQIFNLATGKSITLKLFIRTIEGIVGIKFIKTLVEKQQGDIINTYANTKKINKYFIINKATKLRVGLKKFIDWYKNYYNIK